MAVESFEQNRGEYQPNVNEFFDHFGERAVEAYGHLVLMHHTHSALLDGIEDHGLKGTGLNLDQSDQDFAYDLFKSKGYHHTDSDRYFRRYILGQPADGSDEQGAYFFKAEHEDDDNVGYGFPERAGIFLREMLFVASSDEYSSSERARAQSIASGLIERFIDGDPLRVTITADPFAPEIVNTRLGGVGSHLFSVGWEKVDMSLRHGDTSNEIFVPGGVGAQHLSVVRSEPFMYLPATEAQDYSSLFQVPDGMRRV